MQQIQLHVASVQEEVSVVEKRQAVDMAAETSGVALGYDRIEEAPASNRNYLNFALLAPGIAPSAGSNAQLSTTAVRNPLVDSGFTFGGMRGRNNSITIDANALNTRLETLSYNSSGTGRISDAGIATSKFAVYDSNGSRCDARLCASHYPAWNTTV